MPAQNQSQRAAKSLAEKLINTGQSYELVERISAARVLICFTGLFHHALTIWQADIRTLEDKFSGLPLEHGQHSFRQSIEILENNESYSINIALSLNEVDDAAIKRTIIMVRKYKRLQLGYYEYGEAITFKVD
jgi:hypothetical protein